VEFAEKQGQVKYCSRLLSVYCVLSIGMHALHYSYDS
jgi:hypothetical protein